MCINGLRFVSNICIMLFIAVSVANVQLFSISGKDFGRKMQKNVCSQRRASVDAHSAQRTVSSAAMISWSIYINKKHYKNILLYYIIILVNSSNPTRRLTVSVPEKKLCAVRCAQQGGREKKTVLFPVPFPPFYLYNPLFCRTFATHSGNIAMAVERHWRCIPNTLPWAAVQRPMAMESRGHCNEKGRWTDAGSVAMAMECHTN